MSTPPVRVPITATDETSPAFQSAISKAQAFQASMNATGYSMKEARGAAKLFSDEIGLNLNRHLTGVLASSQLLGGVLAAAFPVAAAVGFLGVAKEIYDKISGTKEIEAAIAASKAWEQHVREVHKQIIEVNRELLLAGKSEEIQRAMRARWMAEDLGQQKEYAQQLKAEIALLDSRDAVHSKQIGTAFGRGAGTGTPVYADVGGLTDEEMKKRKELVLELHNLEVDMALKSAQAGKAGVDAVVAGHKELFAELKDINKQANEFWKYWEKINEELEKSVAKLDSTAFRDIGLRAESQRKQLAPWFDQSPLPPPLTGDSAQSSEVYKIETDLNYAREQGVKVLDSARTATEKYSDAMERWVAIANVTRMSEKDFAAGAKKIGDELDKNTNKAWKKFGDEAERNISQALLFGRSWSDALKTILADLVKLILKMYVFKALAGTGSFYGAFSGLGGERAAGGPVTSGMTYLVGEKGPELFTPGTSGSIVPNAALGGGVHYHIDARGADVSVEQRIMRILPIIENRAVQRSLAAAQERDLRRPWSR